MDIGGYTHHPSAPPKEHPNSARLSARSASQDDATLS